MTQSFTFILAKGTSSDLMFWLKIHLRGKPSEEILQVTWAKKSRNSQKMCLVLPRGKSATGWKRFAICLDSLNPNVKNWGEGAFPCASFAGITRAYNVPHEKHNTTMVDALGYSDCSGMWKDGLICSRPSLELSWVQIGKQIRNLGTVSCPFEIYPLDDFKALFFADSLESREEILAKKEIAINNWLVKLFPWLPRMQNSTNISAKTIFWISLSGIPLQFWTPDIIKNLSLHCGEFLAIEANRLSLSDLSTVKVKIRNQKGPNDIPRVLDLLTPDGDFEILVALVPAGEERSSHKFHTVTILEEEEDELANEVAGQWRIEHSEATISDTWQKRGVCRFRNYREVPTTQARKERGMEKIWQPHTDGSYTTLTHPDLCTRKTRVKHKRRQRKRKKTKNFASSCPQAKSRWRWVPKVRAGTQGTEALVESEGENSNSNLNSPTQVVPSVFENGAPSKPSNPISDENTFVPCSLTEPITTPNFSALAYKRLQIGLEVGMSYRQNESLALALIEKNIEKDTIAAERKRQQHLNQDLGVELRDHLGGNGSKSEDEVGEIRTPAAPFAIELEPEDIWGGSFIQAEFSNESLSIPPGFELSNHCSLRSLKANLKKLYKDKNPLNLTTATSQRIRATNV